MEQNANPNEHKMQEILDHIGQSEEPLLFDLPGRPQFAIHREGSVITDMEKYGRFRNRAPKVGRVALTGLQQWGGEDSDRILVIADTPEGQSVGSVVRADELDVFADILHRPDLRSEHDDLPGDDWR